VRFSVFTRAFLTGVEGRQIVTDWHPTGLLLQVIGYWQTLLAGLLALIAALGTVWITILSANREVEAANRQTAAAQKQIETTLLLEAARRVRETEAFLIATKAAAELVLNHVEAAWSKVTPVRDGDSSQENEQIYAARQSVLCPILEDLRPACVKFGGELTPNLIRLDHRIKAFADVSRLRVSPVGATNRIAPQAGFHDSLSEIKIQAEDLLEMATQKLASCGAELGPLSLRIDQLSH
jgi:hypothetical protein